MQGNSKLMGVSGSWKKNIATQKDHPSYTPPGRGTALLLAVNPEFPSLPLWVKVKGVCLCVLIFRYSWKLSGSLVLLEWLSLQLADSVHFLLQHFPIPCQAALKARTGSWTGQRRSTTPVTLPRPPASESCCLTGSRWKRWTSTWRQRLAATVTAGWRDTAWTPKADSNCNLIGYRRIYPWGLPSCPWYPSQLGLSMHPQVIGHFLVRTYLY